MQTISAPLQLTLPPEKRKASGVAIATTAYSVLLLTSKLIWPSAHERNETLLHLLAEVTFQTILFAVFFTFLRFALPRNKRTRRHMVDENQAIIETATQLAECESQSPELTGASGQSRR